MTLSDLSLADLIALRGLLRERMPVGSPGELERIFGPEYKPIDEQNEAKRQGIGVKLAAVDGEIEKRLITMEWK